MAGDRLSLAMPSHDDAVPGQNGEPLVRLVMQNGRRVGPAQSLDDIRRHTARELQRLPKPLQRLEEGVPYGVEVADALRQLADEVDRHILAHQAK